jgi:hypothetical protein
MTSKLAERRQYEAAALSGGRASNASKDNLVSDTELFQQIGSKLKVNRGN